VNKQPLEIYGLSVCFISTACLTIFSGILLYSITELAFPQLMQNAPLPYSFPAEVEVTPPQKSAQGVNPFISKKTIDHSQRISSKSHLSYARASAIRSIIRSLIAILVTSLVFFIHWRLAKHARNSTPQN